MEAVGFGVEETAGDARVLVFAPDAPPLVEPRPARTPLDGAETIADWSQWGFETARTQGDVDREDYDRTENDA